MQATACRLLDSQHRQSSGAHHEALDNENDAGRHGSPLLPMLAACTLGGAVAGGVIGHETTHSTAGTVGGIIGHELGK